MVQYVSKTLWCEIFKETGCSVLPDRAATLTQPDVKELTMPDMKSALSDALKNTSLRVTQMELLWRWIRDNPGKTAKRICSENIVKHNSCASLLYNMVSRKMLVKTIECDRLGKRGVFTVPHNMAYYELLPRPVKKVVAEKLPVAVSLPVSQPVAASVPVGQVQQSTVQDKVNKMSVAEALEMFQCLSLIFNK